MIGQKLQRDHRIQRRGEIIPLGQLDHRVHVRGLRLARRIGEQYHARAARLHLAQVGQHLFQVILPRRQHHHRQLVVDQRDGAMLHLAGGVALGVQVGDFLELQRPFQRQRIARPAPEEQRPVHAGEQGREPLHPRRIGQQTVHARHRLAHAAQVRLQFRFAHRPALPRQLQGHERQHRQLRGKCLGGRHPHLRPGQQRNHAVGFPRQRRMRHVAQRQRRVLRRAGLEQPQGLQGVRRFAGLG